MGNRQTENTTSYTYVPGTNKLSTVAGTSFGFDNNGNTTGEGARQFVYNQNQRLIQVVDAGVTKGEYTYNGTGQRVKKVTASETTIFHYNTTGQIIAESNSSGTITAEYVYLNEQPLAKIEGVNTYYYHNDHLGTPQKMTDGSGTVVWAADYKPFGEATVAVSTISNNLRFPGQYYDAETGLNYNYFRDYNPSTGRYMQADPMGLKGGLNLYRYVQNPISFVDPLGLFGTNDFWNQYFHGNGAGIDLSAVGLLSAFQNSSSVKNAVHTFLAPILNAAQQNAQNLCGSCATGTKSTSFFVQENSATDVTGVPGLEVVGNSTFFRSAQCHLIANCATKNYSFGCSQKFSIKDKFKDPLDYYDIIPGEFELPFGQIYPITASWTQTLTGSGSW